MDLWIRSQSGKSLTKVSGSFLRMVPNATAQKLEYYIESPEFVLGCYKTEKRALEVLDEIQNILIGKYCTNLNFKDAFKRNFTQEQAAEMLQQQAVYKMPKE